MNNLKQMSLATHTEVSAGGPYYQIWVYRRTSWPEWNPVLGYQITAPASKFQVPLTFSGATAACDPRVEAPPSDPSPTGLRIPPKYADPSQSGLTFDLTEPDQ